MGRCKKWDEYYSESTEQCEPCANLCSEAAIPSKECAFFCPEVVSRWPYQSSETSTVPTPNYLMVRATPSTVSTPISLVLGTSLTLLCLSIAIAFIAAVVVLYLVIRSRRRRRSLAVEAVVYAEPNDFADPVAHRRLLAVPVPVTPTQVHEESTNAAQLVISGRSNRHHFVPTSVGQMPFNGYQPQLPVPVPDGPVQNV